jgi:antitoxin HicB
MSEDAIVVKKNPHIGSSFERWLNAEGIRQEVTAAAIKAVIARQLAGEMKKRKITKQRMAELMRTSRAQVDRLLDPDNGSATIESLQRAARIVGRELRMQPV